MRRQAPSKQFVARAVVVIASAYALLGMVAALEALNDSVVANAATTQTDREWGVWRFAPRVIRDPDVVDVAMRAMPERATYAVLIGSEWRPAVRTRWSSSLERDFLRFHLLPRRLSSSPGARWVFCLACDLGDTHGTVIARGSDGMTFLRVDR